MLVYTIQGIGYFGVYQVWVSINDESVALIIAENTAAFTIFWNLKSFPSRMATMIVALIQEVERYQLRSTKGPEFGEVLPGENQKLKKSGENCVKIWGYGCQRMDQYPSPIFREMNIHKSQLSWCENQPGLHGFWPKTIWVSDVRLAEVSSGCILTPSWLMISWGHLPIHLPIYIPFIYWGFFWIWVWS